MYLVYYLIRLLVLGLIAGHHEANRREQLRAQQPAPPPLPVANLAATPRATPPELAQTHAFRKPWARPRKQIRSRAELIGTPRERARDLVGAMLLSPLVIGVLFFIYALVNNTAVNSVDQWNLPDAVVSNRDTSFAYSIWAASVTILAAWAALILGKIWESRAGEPILRRFSLLVVGLLIGGCSLGLASWLGLSFYNGSEWRELSIWNNALNGRSQNQEQMLLSMASLGITFALIAWWHQCDPLRTKRFSFIMLGLSLLMAFLTHLFLPFMQPWGLLIIGVMSVTLQLTSRWVPLDQRQKIEVS
jgi:hypothetical protein